MKLCILTKNRVKEMHTFNLFKDYEVYLFVEPQDFEAYTEAYPNTQIVNIQENDKGVTFCRNFILNYFKGERILILDDDIKRLFYRDARFKHKQTTPKEVLEELDKILDKGYVQASISFKGSNTLYKKPYKVNGRVWCMSAFNLDSLEKNNIRYDPLAIYFQDFDITAQILSKGLSNCISYRYCFDCVPMGNNKGGQQSFNRKKLSESSLNHLLTKWYGVMKIKHNKKTGCLEPVFFWSKI